MTIATILSVLKAAADPTRLRLLLLLRSGEATVGELVEVLGQSQPRVSRHLRILDEANLVDHFRDGQWVYYRLAATSGSDELVGCAVSLARAGDATVAADQARMLAVRRRRERYAWTAAAGPRRWTGPGSDRPGDSLLQQALFEALGPGEFGDVLDIGVGSGGVLRLLAPRCRSAVGLDVSRGMRVLARSRLQEPEYAHCTIRAGDMQALPFAALSFDLVVLDEVLAIATDPQQAIIEAARVLKPAGRLLVIDHIRPAALRLTSNAGGRAIAENQLGAMLRIAGLRSGATAWFPGRELGLAWLTATPRPAGARRDADAA